MSLEKDYPYTWEADQNAKGYFQIRFKVKSESNVDALETEAVQKMIKKNLQVIAKAVEEAGFTVQPEEELKTKIKVEPKKKEIPKTIEDQLNQEEQEKNNATN